MLTHKDGLLACHGSGALELALGGQEGVEQVLRGLLADSEVTSGLSGYRGIDEIRGNRWGATEL